MFITLQKYNRIITMRIFWNSIGVRHKQIWMQIWGVFGTKILRLMGLATLILQILLEMGWECIWQLSLVNCSRKASAEVCRGKAILSWLGSQRMLRPFSNLTRQPPTEKRENLHNSGGPPTLWGRNVSQKGTLPRLWRAGAAQGSLLLLCEVSLACFTIILLKANRRQVPGAAVQLEEALRAP